MMITNEDGQMQQNGKVAINWFTLNVPTVLAVLAAGWGVATYVNDLSNGLAQMEAFRVSRTAQTDRKFDALEDSIDALDNIPLRMSQVEAQIVATNLRLDKLVENLTNSVELLRRDVNTVGTKVEVLTSKIDAITPARKAMMNGVPPELLR